MIRLPGVCQGCGASVMWTGKRWQDAPLGRGKGHTHRCAEDRPACGAWMPYVRTRCARRPGHGFEHRSPYALENARNAKRMGWAA